MTAFFFHGYALNAVDAKNRLSVPSGYRDTNEKRSGEKQLIVGPAERAPCLVGYDVLRFERPNGWSVVTNFGTEPYALEGEVVLANADAAPGTVPGESTAWLVAPSA